MTRAQGFTGRRLQPIFYSDFLSTFDINPETGFLEVISNEQAVMQSIQNLVLTNVFERPYQPLVGSKVQSLNFEQNDPVTYQLLEQTIQETINNYEPRATNVSVSVFQAPDSNQVEITVTFTTQNITKPVSFIILLPRVR